MVKNIQIIDIYIRGKRYQVPEGLTIMAALEYCGYKLIRGCGCRGGSCGACVTVYNFKKDPALRYGLACQTAAEPGMCFTQLIFFPVAKPAYEIEKLQPTLKEVLNLYPDLVACYGCNTCTKSCPQGLEVMGAVSAALRGDFATVTEKSFDCLMCSMCAARCPRGISPHNIALLCRRLYGRHIVPRSKHLDDRIEEIEAGKFDAEYEKLKKLPLEELRRIYEEREIESK